MAFEIVNMAPLPTADSAAIPVFVTQQYDQVAAGTEIDTGIADNKFVRGRILVKSGLADTQSATFQVGVGAATGLHGGSAATEVVATSPTLVWNTGDSDLSWDFCAAAQTPFQYVEVLGTNGSGTMVYDMRLEVF
jgi:hypothetical protein